VGGESVKAALDPVYRSKKNLEETEKLEAVYYVTARRRTRLKGMQSRGRWPRPR
jgi:hypothetical protein